MDDLRAPLEAGLRKLRVTVPDGAGERLIAYIRLLERWNRAYNLTAVRDPADMVVRHLLDSLAVTPWLEGARIADVGTGPGLPGIPLALAHPDRAFMLVDSAAKKLRFLEHARATLGLGNVEIHRGRAEDYRPSAGFDTVITRAFASLPRMLGAAGHLCGPGGVMLAMKGTRPDAEIAALPAGWECGPVCRLDVPGLEAERHLIVLRPGC